MLMFSPFTGSVTEIFIFPFPPLEGVTAVLVFGVGCVGVGVVALNWIPTLPFPFPLVVFPPTVEVSVETVCVVVVVVVVTASEKTALLSGR